MGGREVRRWVGVYEKDGEKGLIGKGKGVSGDGELGIKVVKGVMEEEMWVNEGGGEFMVGGSGCVGRWVKVYEEGGEGGLGGVKIGRKRKIGI